MRKTVGELDKDYFWKDVLSPEAREKTFVQVDYDEAEELVNQLFEEYMGKDTAKRKEFVKEFITNVDLNTIN